MSIGGNIRKARHVAGMTQTELADKIGTAQKMISRWENDNASPNVITLSKICQALGVSADEILGVKSGE